MTCGAQVVFSVVHFWSVGSEPAWAIPGRDGVRVDGPRRTYPAASIGASHERAVSIQLSVQDRQRSALNDTGSGAAGIGTLGKLLWQVHRTQIRTQDAVHLQALARLGSLTKETYIYGSCRHLSRRNKLARMLSCVDSRATRISRALFNCLT